MPLIRMRCFHASPTEILDAGKVYKVSEELAFALTQEGSGVDGKPAAEVVRAGKGIKPTKPDPGEKDADETADEGDE